MNRETIIGNIIFLGVVVLSFVYGFYLVNNDIEIDTTPLYWPETFEPYPEPPEDYYMDVVEMDCGWTGPEVHPDSLKKWAND